jgi:hypothetical protein
VIGIQGSNPCLSAHYAVTCRKITGYRFFYFRLTYKLHELFISPFLLSMIDDLLVLE